jgi:hypothetical protein
MTTQELISAAHEIASDCYVKNGLHGIPSAYNNNDLRLLVGGQFNDGAKTRIAMDAYNACVTSLVVSQCEYNTQTRCVYMALNGQTFNETEAKEYYGERFETAILAKVVVDADGNAVGTW